MSRCFEAYNGKPLERTRRTGPEAPKVRDVFLDLMRDRLTDFFIRLEERRSDRLFDIYNTEDKNGSGRLPPLTAKSEYLFKE
jgi:hypothetical protein